MKAYTCIHVCTFIQYMQRLILQCIVCIIGIDTVPYGTLQYSIYTIGMCTHCVYCMKGYTYKYIYMQGLILQCNHDLLIIMHM